MIVSMYIPKNQREIWSKICDRVKAIEKQTGKRYGIGRYICENTYVWEADNGKA